MLPADAHTRPVSCGQSIGRHVASSRGDYNHQLANQSPSGSQPPTAVPCPAARAAQKYRVFLISSQHAAGQEIPCFYGKRMFVTVFTTFRNWFLS
jgi:hypothetical protein